MNSRDGRIAHTALWLHQLAESDPVQQVIKYNRYLAVRIDEAFRRVCWEANHLMT